jgi:hypothetical protein
MIVQWRSIFLCCLVCAVALWYTADPIRVFGFLPNRFHKDTTIRQTVRMVHGNQQYEGQLDDSEWMNPFPWMIQTLPSGQRVVQERMNQSLPIDVNELAAPMRIVQDMNASVDLVWEQLFHYLTTATWNKSFANLLVIECSLQYNETVNVTWPYASNATVHQPDSPSRRRKPRRSKQATDETLKQQQQSHLGIGVNVKFLPFLFTEQRYLLHFTLVPEQHVVFWNWTVDTSLLHLGSDHIIADSNYTVPFGHGYASLLQQSSNPPLTRLFHCSSMEWSNLFPAAVSALLEFVPPVEGAICGWCTRFMLTKVVRRIKVRSETLQSMSLPSNQNDRSAACSATRASAHTHIPPLLRQWWRKIRRLLPHEGDRDDRFDSDEGFCDAQFTNVTSSPFNHTHTSAPTPGVRPIGVTRYLLVCSVLSLTLFNVYLFFS